MIKPTIGRKVWYHPSCHDDSFNAIDHAQPFDATIVYVWNDHLVNVLVVDHHGHTQTRTSVTFLQADETPNEGSHYVRWAPHQVGQAEDGTARAEVEINILSHGDLSISSSAVKVEAPAVKVKACEPVTVAKQNAPRVMPDKIEALMKRVVYTFDVRPNGSRMTFCHAFLDGDFWLATGNSSCVSNANFNEETGRTKAQIESEGNARDKLWELEGYSLYCNQR